MGDFKMPSLGADMEAGKLVEWRVRVGDRVKRGDIVAVVDTDKAAIEVEIWESGTVEALLVQPGEKVAVGASLARIRSDVEATVSLPQTKPVPVSAERVRASPAARKRAEELGVDLSGIFGSGPDGAITFEDVEAKPVQRSSVSASDDRQSGMRRAIASAMERSKREIPHYYLSTRVDIKRASQWLESQNRNRPVTERLLPVVPLLRAVALACKKFPEMNGYWKEGKFQAAEQVNLGVAISIRQGGLIAPAIMAAQEKSLDELMLQLRDLVNRTRTGTLRGSEMTEGTITVSNLGDTGVDTIFGVIYPPQVALIGFGAVFRAPVEGDRGIEFRPFMNVSLSGDHRASDGHRGALFIKTVDQLLQEPEKL